MTFHPLARRKTTPAVIAALVAVVWMGGCSSERFQLANREDTRYEKQIAMNDVRVPVNPATVSTPAIVGAPTPVPGGVPVAPGAVPPQIASAVPIQGGIPAATGQAYLGAVAATGGELSGRIVNQYGQPAARATIQVNDARQGQVVAEVVADDAGIFQVRNLTPGIPYRVAGTWSSLGIQLAGSVVATAPDNALILQLQPENIIANNGRSPLGNRLSSQAPISLPSSAQPGEVGVAATTPPLGNVTVTGVQTSTAAVAVPAATAIASTAAAAAQPASRVLPPSAAKSTADASLPGGATQNIPWDLPASSATKAASASVAETASAKEADLSLPGNSELKLPSSKDLDLEDFSSAAPAAKPSAPATTASPAPAAAAAKNTSLAFAGSGLEYATVYDLQGNKRPVGALAGDLILLDFFGSWCGPCRRSIPHLNEINAKYGPEGLRVVGIASEYGDMAAAVKSANDAVSQFGIQYPVVVSPMDEKSEIRDHFGVSAYPTVILIDRTGKVYFKGEGGDADSIKRLDAAIQKALSASKLAAR